MVFQVSSDAHGWQTGSLDGLLLLCPMSWSVPRLGCTGDLASGSQIEFGGVTLRCMDGIAHQLVGGLRKFDKPHLCYQHVTYVILWVDQTPQQLGMHESLNILG